MEIVITIIVALLLLVGALGTIFPILPGSTLVLIGLLVWAIGIGGPVGWTVFIIGGLLVLAGMFLMAWNTWLTWRGAPVRDQAVLPPDASEARA